MAGNYLNQFMDHGKHHRHTNPPGGYTNDIFDLEQRQRIADVVVYEDKSVKNNKKDQVPKKHLEIEDLVSSPGAVTRCSRTLRRSLSEGKTKQTIRTPPIATGKENEGTHFKNNPLISTIVCKGAKKLDDSEDEEVPSLKQHSQRNPITGEGMEIDGTSRSKMEDSTNINKETVEVQSKGSRRPCIRVRQPPGGKSSIVF